ncbi:hypothetical protein ACQPZZ_15890 [Microbispora sp. CA-135349]|uniref:hypothetical protein n=1 Tax=Microbispora sp. CA-135349 TaxID=3239953 RepID=UPI003D90653E
MTLSATAVAATVAATHSSSGRALGPEPQWSVPVDDMTVPDRTRRLQVGSWWFLGGKDLQDRYITDLKRLDADLKDAAASGHGGIDPARIRPVCADMGQIARDAKRYFPAPDPGIQSFWRTFTTQLEKAGGHCRQSLDHGDTGLFHAYINEVTAAGQALTSVAKRVAEAAQAAL